MRETDQGPRNGNPVRCLLEDKNTGANICQIGLAPFANTRRMFREADAAGIEIWDIEAVRRSKGIEAAIDAALERSQPCRGDPCRFRHRRDRPRGNCPARPAPAPAAWRSPTSSAPPAGSPRRRGCGVVDLTEFDPSLDARRHQRADRRALGGGKFSPASAGEKSEASAQSVFAFFSGRAAATSGTSAGAPAAGAGSAALTPAVAPATRLSNVAPSKPSSFISPSTIGACAR